MEEILLSTINENSILPSFLELHSLYQIAAAPSLTLRHLTSAILPTSLQNYSENCHDVLSLAQLLLQMKVLLSTGASVGEHLYGLVQVTKSQNGACTTYKPLTTSEKKICVISMLLPFALLKLKEVSLAPEDEEEDDFEGVCEDGYGESSQDTRKSRISIRVTQLLRHLHHFKSLFTHFIKKHKVSIAILCMLHKMSTGVQQLSYLFSLTSSFYPVHQYLGISLIRKKNLPTSTPSIPASTLAGTPSTTLTPNTSSSSSSSTTRNHAVTILFISALCIKVAEMLNRVDSTSTYSPPPPATSGEDGGKRTNHYIIPEPPTILTHYCTLPTDPSLCPLCKQTKKEPSASRGGYVFCYACLCQSVTRHPFCPITGIGCTIKDIIRLSDS